WKMGEYLMGTLAVNFPQALEKAGFKVATQNFCDWRGSLDVESTQPSSEIYGWQGAYSASLRLPKLVIQKYVRDSRKGGKRNVMNHFLPIMRSRALPFIPGGMTLANLYDKLAANEPANVPIPRVPELALQMLRDVGLVYQSEGFADPV